MPGASVLCVVVKGCVESLAKAERSASPESERGVQGRCSPVGVTPGSQHSYTLGPCWQLKLRLPLQMGKLRLAQNLAQARRQGE